MLCWQSQDAGALELSDLTIGSLRQACGSEARLGDVMLLSIVLRCIGAGGGLPRCNCMDSCGDESEVELWMPVAVQSHLASKGLGSCAASVQKHSICGLVLLELEVIDIAFKTQTSRTAHCHNSARDILALCC